MAQCTAHSKQSGQRCKRMAVPGKTVCAMHGGKSLAGAAHPNFKHGRYSKVLPKGFLGDYQAGRADPDLLAIRDDLALLDAMTVEATGRIERGESGPAWGRLGLELRKLSDYANMGDEAGVRLMIEEMAEIIQEGKMAYTTRDEIRSNLLLRSKLVDAERKRLIDLQQMVTKDRLAAMAGVLVDIISRKVIDPMVRVEIAQEIALLFTAAPTPRLEEAIPEEDEIEVEEEDADPVGSEEVEGLNSPPLEVEPADPEDADDAVAYFTRGYQIDEGEQRVEKVERDEKSTG